jgi:hypothetical protein
VNRGVARRVQLRRGLAKASAPDRNRTCARGLGNRPAAREMVARFPRRDGRPRREGAADYHWILHGGSSTRDGATPVDLVDGEELCDLLKQFGPRCHHRASGGRTGLYRAVILRRHVAPAYGGRRQLPAPSEKPAQCRTLLRRRHGACWEKDRFGEWNHAPDWLPAKGRRSGDQRECDDDDGEPRPGSQVVGSRFKHRPLFGLNRLPVGAGSRDRSYPR